jgi:hypothetical protein
MGNPGERMPVAGVKAKGPSQEREIKRLYVAVFIYILVIIHIDKVIVKCREVNEKGYYCDQDAYSQ